VVDLGRSFYQQVTPLSSLRHTPEMSIPPVAELLSCLGKSVSRIGFGYPELFIVKITYVIPPRTTTLSEKLL
jgi:hypothetical protein